MIENKIIHLYNNEKLSCSDISKKINKSESFIYKVLLTNNINLRSKSEANKIFNDNILILLYNLGLSYSQISKILGIDSSTVSKRFKKIGFCTRTVKNSNKIKYTEEEFNKYFYNNRFIEYLTWLF